MKILEMSNSHLTSNQRRHMGLRAVFSTICHIIGAVIGPVMFPFNSVGNLIGGFIGNVAGGMICEALFYRQ